MDTETSEDGHRRATTNEEKTTVHFTGNVKLYYANNDRRVEYESLGFKGSFIIFYNLYNLKEKTEEVSAEAISAIEIPWFFLLTHCFGNAMPKRNLFSIYGTRSLRVSYFFLIVFSNRSAV